MVMTKVLKSSYPGWNNHPVYQCSETEDWYEVSSWMHANDCEPFLLSSGGHGYIFQVRKHHAWFVLRWS
jgi:hypothetical protein